VTFGHSLLHLLESQSSSSNYKLEAIELFLGHLQPAAFAVSQRQKIGGSIVTAQNSPFNNNHYGPRFACENGRHVLHAKMAATLERNLLVAETCIKNPTIGNGRTNNDPVRGFWVRRDSHHDVRGGWKHKDPARYVRTVSKHNTLLSRCLLVNGLSAQSKEILEVGGNHQPSMQKHFTSGSLHSKCTFRLFPSA
jgi:hypothetical protein